MSTLSDLTVPKIDQSGPPKTGEFTYIDISSIDNELKRVVEPKRLPVGAAPSRAKQRLQPGDVLVSMTRPNLNAVAIVSPDLKGAIGSTGFHVLRPVEGIEPRWLFYGVQTHAFIEAMSSFVQGALYPAVRPKDIKGFGLDAPSWSEQQRIVAEIEKQFSRLDEAVANLKRVRANLKRYKAAVLKAAVEGKLTEDWRKQHLNVERADNLLKRILSERRAKWNGKGQYNQSEEPETRDLPQLPGKWIWARLDAIAALKGGITVDKNRKSSTARTVPYLRVANVQRGYLDLAEIKTIEAPDADIKDLRLIPNDILFNEGGDRDKLGRGWLWEGQLPECIHQNHVFRARLFLAEVSPKLVSWWGNSFGQAYFLREGKQTTNLASLNLTKLSAFPIPLPPAAEQQQIVAEVERRLSVIEELEAAVEANLTRADRLRQSILKEAFEGELIR